MASLSYLLLDVFTDQPYTGNPLAVIPFPPMPLTDAQMQAIAAEFNLSETVFIFPPDDPGSTARLRIFTPAQELPFAGHPTVGAAVALGLLAERKQVKLDRGHDIIFEETIGLVAVTLRLQDEYLGSATLRAAQLPERGLMTLGKQQLAEAVSLTPEELLWDETWYPAAYSCGVPYLFIPVPSRAVVDRARIHTTAWESFLQRSWAPSVFVFSLDPLDGTHHVYGRMFGPEKGIVEDPATGSAAAAFAGYLFVREKHPHGRLRWVVEQGVAMGRPSVLEITAHCEQGVLQSVHVGGRAVLVGEGQLLNLPGSL